MSRVRQRSISPVKLRSASDGPPFNAKLHAFDRGLEHQSSPIRVYPEPYFAPTVQSREPTLVLDTRHADNGDNLTSLIDLKGNVYSFNPRNRRLTMRYPDGSQESNGWDAVSNLISFTTRSGAIATHVYDARNRETSITWNDSVTPAVAKTYDDASRLATEAAVLSTLSYNYNN
jgi:YD repeat-containing protein